MQQEVAPGHPATSPSCTAAIGDPAEATGAAEPVDRVESPGHDQPLGHWAADLGAMPEVSEGDVRLAGHNALNLSITDALDVGQRQPDAISTPIGKVGGQLSFNGDSVSHAAAGHNAANHAAASHPASSHAAASHPAADHTAAGHNAAGHNAAGHTAANHA